MEPSSSGWRRRRSGRALQAAVAAFALVAFFFGLWPAGTRLREAFAAFTGAASPPRTPRGAVLVRHAGDDSQFWVPDQRVVQAVEDLGGRVTKTDVLQRGAEAKGLERELMQLARASGAGMSVNEKGELLYEFPPGLASELASSNAAAKLQQLWGTVSPWLGYAGRVLFGVSLLAICAILYTAVLVLVNTSTSDREDRQGNRQSWVSENSFGMMFGQDIFWWLTPRPYGYYNYGYYGGGYYNVWGPPEPPPKMSFFESVFSFVFGDGDPNEKLLSESRWQLIGDVIANSGGAVVAEQVAPYLDPPKLPEGSSELDRRRAVDAAMLPVLLRFRGKPEVGPKGDIVYVFPELQESRAAGELLLGGVPTKELKQRLQSMGCSTSAVERADIIADYRRNVQAIQSRSAPSAKNRYLPEKELKFSEAEEGQIGMSIALGAFAFLATLYLGSQIATGKALLLARYYPIMGLVTQAFPLLLGYTGAFLGIPAYRWLNLTSANEKISERNAWRAEQAAKLQSPEPSLRDRLTEAAAWVKEKTGFGQAVYDSSKASTTDEAVRKTAKDDLEAFDRQLGSR